MNKDELIARLKELGEKLNREVILTGSKEDLALRIAELEEELDDSDSDSDSDNPESSDEINSSQDTDKKTVLESAGADTDKPHSEWVSVETLVTLHIDALHETLNENLSIVEPGVVIRVSQQCADYLLENNLARHV